MFLYIDKFDYLANNLHNDEIDEEISMLQEKLEKIEENNQTYFKRLQTLVKEKEDEMKRVNFDSRQIYQNRFDNLSNQIFSLQMKQIAESVWNIKHDVKKNKFILIFDQSEGMDTLFLDEEDYRDLIKYRDPINSISVYDLFQEKIHSYYTSNLRETPSKESNIKIKKKRGRKPKISKSNLDSLPKKRGRKPKSHDGKSATPKKAEKIQIANVVNINYGYCHHCKQRKPAEVLKKCSSSLTNKPVERPLKTFLINNTTCVKSKLKFIQPEFKNFIITNYSGDPKEILDGYLNKSKNNLN
jgi:hypothetical protein